MKASSPGHNRQVGRVRPRDRETQANSTRHVGRLEALPQNHDRSQGPVSQAPPKFWAQYLGGDVVRPVVPSGSLS
ncbi:hypothetical protein OAK53_01640, partial [bacterium]|nr:hypothetical protein [bacterium]